MMEVINDAYVFVEEGGNLYVSYGSKDNPRSVSLELSDTNDRDIVLKLLEDPNFWAAFVGSLSAALGKKNG